MAVAFDAVGPSSNGADVTTTTAGSTLTWTHTVGSGTNRYLVAGVSVGGSSAAAGTYSATFGGAAMTRLGAVQPNAAQGGTGYVLLFGIANPAAGAGTFTFTNSAPTGTWTLSGGSVSFTGADSVGTAVTANGSSTAISVSVTGTSTSNMVAAHMGAGSTLSSTGNTQRYLTNVNGSSSAGNSAGSTATSAAGAVTMTGTVSAADDWGIVAVEVKAAAGGTAYTSTPADTAAAADNLSQNFTVVGSDALQRRTLTELRAWKSWLTTNNATGFVGEFGWVTLYSDAPSWNALGDTYLREAENLSLHTTAWASGRNWGNGYPLGFHVGTNVGDPLTIANGAVASVLANHPSRNGRRRGVNLSGWEAGVNTAGGGTVRSASGYVHTTADFTFLAANGGTDTVRLPFAWERLQPTLGAALDTTALTTLDGMLTAARQAGIGVILDLHNYGRYTQSNGTTVVALGGSLTNTQFSDFWTKLSTWVKADSQRSSTVIGYGLMNEPHDLTGGASTWQTSSQAALTAIRNNADTRLVLVAGYAWSSLTNWTTTHPSGWITDSASNFVYEAHHYWDTQSQPSSRSGTYQQSSTGPILPYATELTAAQNAEASGGTAYTQTPIDTAAGGDAVSPSASYARPIADAAAVADAASSAQGYFQTTADGATAADSTSQVSVAPRSIADTAAAGDATQVARDMQSTVADTGTATDTAQAQTASPGQAGVSDNTTTTDTATPRSVSFRSAADTAAVADNVIPAMGRKVSVSDATPVTDSLLSVVGISPVIPAVELDYGMTIYPGEALAGSATASLTAPFGTAPFGTAPFGGGSGGDGTGVYPVRVDEADSADPTQPTGSYPTAEAGQVDLAFTPVVLVDDGTFGDAIDSDDRIPVYSLKADWGRTGLYDHPLSDLTAFLVEATVDRSITGSLPTEIGLVEGYATAALKVTIEGIWQDPAGLVEMDPVDVFAPYRTDSPLYGKPLLRTPILFETGFMTADGPRLQRRFTGTVTSIAPSSANRSVQIGALDSTSSLRASITVYGSALYQEYLARYGPIKYRDTINSQWLIDRALRANGIYTSPPPRSDAILSVTGHGSFIPEIGAGGASETYYTTYTGEIWEFRNWGLLATIGIGEAGRWTTTSQLTAANGDGFGFSMWLGLGGSRGSDQQLLSFDMTLEQSWMFNFGINGSGQPYLDVFSTVSHRAVATGYTPASATTWKFVGCHVAIGATTFTATFRIDGVTYTSTATYGNSPIGFGTAFRPLTYAHYSWLYPFTNFQMWKSATPPTAPWQGEDPNWVPQADIDPGVNTFTGLPTMQGVDTWELIKAVTDAEGSIFQFTEEGRPQFITSAGDAEHGRTHPVTETMTADRNLADLASVTDESTIRNTINIKTKRVLVTDWQDYFKATTVDQFDTPTGTSVFDIPISADIYDVPLNHGTIGVTKDLADLQDASFVFYTSDAGTASWSPGWPASNPVSPIKDKIRVCIVPADSPDEFFVNQGDVPRVYISVERTSATMMRVFITNNSDITVRFATPSTVGSDNIARDGQPALIIPARLVETEDAEQLETYTDNSSVALYGASGFDVGGSDETWRQLPDGLRTVAAEVLATTAHPVPVLDAVDVPHDPRRKIGNRVILADPDGLGSVEGTIVALETTYQSSGAMDKVTVRPLAAPGQDG